MRKTIPLFLAAFLVILTACSSTPAKRTSNDQMANIVYDSKTQKVNELRERFDILKSGRRLITTAAMLGDTIDAPCTLYHEFESLRTVKSENDKLDLGKTDFSKELDNEIKRMAQKVTTAAYDRMKSGKLIGCAKLMNDPLTLFGDIAKLMDEYGRPTDTEEFDPDVLRAACLREIKPEVQEILASIKKFNASGETLGTLSNYVDKVKRTWHFTPEEIGVPKAMIARLDL